MNKRFLIPALAWSLLALSFAGCTDDNMSGSDPLPEGTEFDFGTTVESNRSRTYYDPTDENNPAATSWKIFWNYESSLYDHIYIYSPQALTSANQASYTVQATARILQNRLRLSRTVMSACRQVTLRVTISMPCIRHSS